MTTSTTTAAQATGAAAAPTTARAARPGVLTGLGLAVLLVAYLPVNMTFGSVNLLAPAITTDLGVAMSGGQLVLSAYTTTFAATLVVAGRLGDRYGRRRLLAAGLAAFAALSVLAAFAPSLPVLVALRAGLGIAAGLFTPQVLSTIQATAPERLRALGVTLFTAVSGVATIAGQILAGAVAGLAGEHLGWRAVQAATGVIAVAALLALRTVPESRSSAPLALDLRGAALLGSGLLLLVVPLTLGASAGWPAPLLGMLAAAGVVLALFARSQRAAERRGDLPVVPPSVLRTPAVRLGLVMTLLFFTGYGAFLYEFSALAQGALGVDAGGTVVLLLGFGGGFVATALLLPVIERRTGRWTMTGAAIAQAAVLGALALVVGSGHGGATAALQPLLVALGSAQALMYGPVLRTVLSRTPTWAAGVAGGLFTTLQQLGLGLGVALLGGLFQTVAAAAPAGATAGLPRGFAVAAVVQAGLALVFAALAARIARDR
ncbi:MFS transporter [Krasilnikoviella flava]|uniref:Major Facilitator Superfamily protein n=1 Tax=Krasilnikoviella flava TaxID=526729 RepID=A0A1T5LXW0_9MICO|nr:MFS transporter [Krasilnikoviella flava]SKC80762.1 Major Facilitator Superfamily protein [Krasilnikoviella flava]